MVQAIHGPRDPCICFQRELPALHCPLQSVPHSADGDLKPTSDHVRSLPIALSGNPIILTAKSKAESTHCSARCNMPPHYPPPSPALTLPVLLSCPPPQHSPHSATLASVPSPEHAKTFSFQGFCICCFSAWIAVSQMIALLLPLLCLALCLRLTFSKRASSSCYQKK